MGVTMKIALSDKFVTQMMGQLKNLEQTVDKDVLRPAARAGALVFYELLHANVPFKSGKLLNAIYHAYVTELDTRTSKTYRVGVNGAKGSAETLKNASESTKARPASHWWWLEFGHMQRYASRLTDDGFVTLVRPEKFGTTTRPNPKKASQAEMDAYYLPRKGGPKHIQGKAYIRKTFLMGREQAKQAIIDRAREKVAEYLTNKQVVNTDVD